MKRYPLLINLLWLFSFAIFNVNCQKGTSGGDGTVVDPGTPVSISVSGRVTDNNHLPISGAAVKAGTGITTTDVNGYFRLKAVTVMNPNAAFIKVEKDGFFLGSRTFRATAGSTGYVAIQLIKKISAGSFLGTAGGSVTVPDNGGKIQFPADAVVNTAGNATYSGNVIVSAFFINPAANDFQERMPGALRGIDNNNQEVGLQSFGMLAVELTGMGNEKLQLAQGKSATLTFPIPTGLQAQAPATIPLWSFNDTTGLWKQEGTATRQGNNYVGTVGHFSFWNCDYPLPVVKLTGAVLNQNGLPLSSVKVLIKTDDAISTAEYAYTDTAGSIMGYVPANKNLQLTIYNKCDELIYTKNIGPFTTTANLGNLTITTSAATLTRFTGTVINCTGGPVNSGFVNVSIGTNRYIGTVVNGTFSLVISRCSNASTTASVSVFDDVNIVQGSAIQIAVTDTVVATGALAACGTPVSEYFNYKLNGTSNSFKSPDDSISMSKAQNGDLAFWITRKVYRLPADQAYFVFAPPVTSTTALSSISIDNNNSSFRLKSPATITLTENGGIGGYISGTFSADVTKDSISTAGKVEVSFRVKRFY